MQDALLVVLAWMVAVVLVVAAAAVSVGGGEQLTGADAQRPLAQVVMVPCVMRTDQAVDADAMMMMWWLVRGCGGCVCVGWVGVVGFGGVGSGRGRSGVESDRMKHTQHNKLIIVFRRATE